MRRLACLLVTISVTFHLPAAAQPANDQCSNAEVLELDAYIWGSNELATSDLFGSSCSGFDDADVWYVFTAPPDAAAEYRFQIAESWDSTLLTPTISAFDECGGAELACDTGHTAPKLDLQLSPGQTVYIRVAGVDQAQGAFPMTATLTPPPPSNDECAGATPLPLTEDPTDPLHGDYVEANAGVEAACFSGEPDLWYSFTAPDADRFRFTVHVLGSGEMNMAVYAACGIDSPLACDADCSVTGRAELDMAAGQTVYLRASACTTFDGLIPYYLRVDRAPATPANDHCADAVALTPGTTIAGTNAGATDLNEPDPGCLVFGSGDRLGVWYTLTNPASEPRIFHLTAAPLRPFFTPVIRVFDGCNGNQIACGGEGQGPDGSTSLNVTLFANETVLVRVAGATLEEGGFDLSVSAPLLPAVNDECAGALPIVAGSSTAASSASATESFALFPDCENQDTHDLWYALTNTTGAPAIYVFDIAGTSLTSVTLNFLESCEALPYACTVLYSSDTEAQFDILLDAGQTTLIRIAGSSFAVGDFVLNVSEPIALPPAPANDTCAAATAIAAFPFFAQVEAGVAEPDVDTSCNVGEDLETSGGVWYAFTAPFTGSLQTQANTFLPELSFALFEGGCGDLVEVTCGGSFPGVLPVQAGVEYLLLVGRVSGSEASARDVYDFQLDLLVEPGYGEACGDAVAVDLPIRGRISLESAMNEGPADAPAGSCNGFDTIAGGMNHSAYLSVTPTASGVLAASFDPAFFEGMAVIYEGVCGSLTELACAHGPNALDFTIDVEAGGQYIIQLGSYDLFWFGGDVTFSMELLPPACAADLDGTGGVDVFDLLAYLDLWFAADVAAERTGDDPAVIDVFDLLVYLDAWFAGCD